MILPFAKPALFIIFITVLLLPIATPGYGEVKNIAATSELQIAAGGWHTVGLREDGTVVASGRNYSGECNVGSWTDIRQVAAGGCHTVGLKEDGRVITAGSNYYGQCNVQNWTDIKQVAAGVAHTVGLREDGTVVAVGDNSKSQCNFWRITDIQQIPETPMSTPRSFPWYGVGSGVGSLLLVSFALAYLWHRRTSKRRIDNSRKSDGAQEPHPERLNDCR